MAGGGDDNNRRGERTRVRLPDPGRRRSRGEDDEQREPALDDRTRVRRVGRPPEPMRASPSARQVERRPDRGTDREPRPRPRVRRAPDDLIRNPLIDESGEILTGLVKVARLPEYAGIAELRRFFVQGLRDFNDRVRMAGVPAETAEAAQYVLAGFVDEQILNTPWGKGGWVSLAEDFGYEILRAGEQVFSLVERAAAPATRDYDLLELIYVCLSLGFVGKYAMTKDWEELRRLRAYLYRVINERRDFSAQPLSPHWESEVEESKPLASYIPLWVIGSVVLAALVLMYFGYSWALHGVSDSKRDTLEVLPPSALPVAAGLRCDRCPPDPGCPLDCAGCPDDPRCPRCDTCPPDPRCPADCEACGEDPRCAGTPPPDPCAVCPPDPVWCPANCDACPTDDRCAAPPPEPEPERCETYVLVTYPHGTAELTADKRKILDEVVAVMKAEPGYQLEILGRTDYTGPRAVNERLSKERATIVYTYLAEHGIEPSRMRFKALWDSDPLRPADPADFKRVNRSTQMKYLCDGEQPESE